MNEFYLWQQFYLIWRRFNNQKWFAKLTQITTITEQKKKNA